MRKFWKFMNTPIADMSPYQIFWATIVVNTPITIIFVIILVIYINK